METNFIKTNLKIILSSLIVAVILFLAIFLGLNKGQAMAQSEILVQTAQNLNLGLQFFYNDENRFPSAVEFANQGVMLNYFSTFPPQDLISKDCSQSYVYKRITDSNFQINFCLPVAIDNYNKDWNVINGQPASK